MRYSLRTTWNRKGRVVRSGRRCPICGDAASPPRATATSRTRSSAATVFGDVFPDVGEVRKRFRMEDVAAHPSARRRSLVSRNRLNASSPSIGSTRPVLRSSYRVSSVSRTVTTSSR